MWSSTFPELGLHEDPGCASHGIEDRDRTNHGGRHLGGGRKDGFLRGAKYLIHDRDPLFTEAFIAILEAGGVKSVAIPAQSPNCNPYAERFVKTIKYECLNHFVIFGERHVQHLIKEFLEHYMTERFHQGIGGQLIRNVGPTNDNGADGKVACRSRLGGLLNYYHREAA
jgi:putative transposase